MAPQRRIDVVLDSVKRLLRIGATANLLNLLQKQHPADLELPVLAIRSVYDVPGRTRLVRHLQAVLERALDPGVVAHRPVILGRDAPARGAVLEQAAQPTLLLRYTRLMFTEVLKRRMQELLGYGLAMEGLALMEQVEAPQ